jgi:hypothetical protein
MYDDPADIDDLRLALCLLGGIAEKDSKGLPSKKYLDENSVEERACRKALALRSQKPLDSMVRHMLASMLDPQHPNDEYEMIPTIQDWGERQIRFSRPRGRPSERLRHFYIASDLFQLRRDGISHEDAKAILAERYGMTADAVELAWRQQKASPWFRSTLKRAKPNRRHS